MMDEYPAGRHLLVPHLEQFLFPEHVCLARDCQRRRRGWEPLYRSMAFDHALVVAEDDVWKPILLLCRRGSGPKS